MNQIMADDSKASHPSSKNQSDVPAQPARPKRRWRRVLLALLFGTIFGGFLVEGMVLLFFGEQAKFPRQVVEAPWGLRYNNPGAHYRHKSADGTWYFKINNQGMRADSDYSYDKPPGVKRIVVVGDSMCIGYEVDARETFASILEERLAAAGKNVQVLNAGVSGYSTAEAALYIERELLKYSPDLIVSSFYQNDLTDNIRSGLFRLAGGKLAEGRKSYTPAGGLGNFLNTNWFFNVLSERSNSFVFVKERLTMLVKRRIVEENERKLDEMANAAAAPKNEQQPRPEDYKERLYAEIVHRLHDRLQERQIPLVIVSIPSQRGRYGELFEICPTQLVDFSRTGLEFVSGKSALDPYVKEKLLYHERSHGHVTAFAHEVLGSALAENILEKQHLK